MKKIYYATILASLFLFSQLYSDTVDIRDVFISKLKVVSNKTLIEKGQPSDRYSPQKAFDGNKNTAWCVNKNDYKGAVIEASFNPIKSSGIRIANGLFINRKLFYANNRVKDYKITFTTKDNQKIIKKGTFYDNSCGSSLYEYDLGDGSRTPEEICSGYVQNSDKMDCINYIKNNPKLVNACELDYYGKIGGGNRIEFSEQCFISIKLEILSVYPGNKYGDTCISEISLTTGVSQMGNHPKDDMCD